MCIRDSGDANAIVLEMASEVLPVVKKTPVLAGVCGTDPFRLMPNFLREVDEAGFAGVQNFPTVGLMDGEYRQGLEETGMGYDLEVDMIGVAAERGLLTTPYVFDPESAEAMTRAGADVLVPHMGLATKGAIGHAGSGAPALDLALAVRALRDGVVPPTSSRDPLLPAAARRVGRVEGALRRVLVVAAGSAGGAGALVLEAAR